jgi:hydroxyacylglutathione hydrolase
MIIFENKTFKIESFISGSLENNSYLLISKTTHHTIIIDIPDNPKELINAIPKNKLDKSKNIDTIKAIITHGHYDHIEGVDFAKKRLGEINISIGLEDSKYLNYSGKITKLKRSKKIINEDLELVIIYTPGHTAGSICLYLEIDDKKFLFTGDTLFPGGPGKTVDSKSFNKIYNSITKNIYTLPNETIIFPGHGKSISIEQSKKEFESFNFKSILFGEVTWNQL